MKITESRLRQIIRELLDEVSAAGAAAGGVAKSGGKTSGGKGTKRGASPGKAGGNTLMKKRSKKRRRKHRKGCLGLGPCCFMPEQMISMADNTFKKIVDIKEGDLVQVWDEKNNKIINSPVKEIATRPLAEDVYELHLENGKVLTPTGNHPFLSKVSDTLSPAPLSAGPQTIDMSEAKWTTLDGYEKNHAGGNGFLKLNDYVYDTEDGWVKIIDIVPVEGEYLTYNLIDMETGTFIADGIITHNSTA